MRAPAVRPFTLCAALSLVVFLGVLAAWARSSYVGQAVFDGHVGSAVAQRGHAQIAIDRVTAYAREHPVPTAAELRRMNDLTAEMNLAVAEQNRLAGLVMSSLPRPWPYWWVAALAAVLPAAWLLERRFVRARAALRLGEGRCPACGYDLRATPRQCPECGAAAATSN